MPRRELHSALLKLSAWGGFFGLIVGGLVGATLNSKEKS